MRSGGAGPQSRSGSALSQPISVACPSEAPELALHLLEITQDALKRLDSFEQKVLGPGEQDFPKPAPPAILRLFAAVAGS
jgi:hypothetical protein